jgi:hypothetical protein
MSPSAKPAERHPNAQFVSDAALWLPGASFDQALDFYEDMSRDPRCDDWTVAQIGKLDRYFLLTHLLGGWYAVHPWVYARCREVEADPDSYLDLWARYHFKSSTITFAGVIQEVLNDPEITVGLFSFNRPLAKKFLNQIKVEFEHNGTIKRLYSDVLWDRPDRQSPKWSEDEGIVVKRQGNPREATIEAHGLTDSLPTGRHFQLRVYDDIVTEKSVTSPEMIEKTTERLELSYDLCTLGGGREWFCGTRYAYGDTYQVIMERESVRPRIYPATDDGTFEGKPVLLSPEAWEELKKKKGSHTIATQQLLNPIAGSALTFRPEDLRFYDVRPRTVNCYIAVDAARSKKKSSDRTAMAVVLVDAHYNWFLVDGFCHRMNLSERWYNLMMLHRKWKRAPGVQMVKVGYEKYSSEADLDYIKEQMEIATRAGRLQDVFQINELRWLRDGPDSHIDRVQRLQPRFENWSIWLPYNPKCPDPTKSKVRVKEPQYTARQRELMAAGTTDLMARPIMHKDEENRVYDLVHWFIRNEFMLFPGVHVDFLDALSRIEDLEPKPPIIRQRSDLEPSPKEV